MLSLLHFDKLCHCFFFLLKHVKLSFPYYCIFISLSTFFSQCYVVSLFLHHLPNLIFSHNTCPISPFTLILTIFLVSHHYILTIFSFLATNVCCNYIIFSLHNIIISFMVMFTKQEAKQIYLIYTIIIKFHNTLSFFFSVCF